MEKFIKRLYGKMLYLIFVIRGVKHMVYKQGLDWDGDLLFYKNKRYYIDVSDRFCWRLKELEIWNKED